VIDKYAMIAALSFAGDGVLMVRDALKDSAASYSFASEMPMLAPSIAVLGFRQYQEGNSVTPENLSAVYVRASDAEINERWQQQKLQQPAGK